MAIDVTKSKLMLVSSKHNHSQLYSKHSNIPFHDSCIEVVTCEHVNISIIWLKNGTFISIVTHQMLLVCSSQETLL